MNSSNSGPSGDDVSNLLHLGEDIHMVDNNNEMPTTTTTIDNLMAHVVKTQDDLLAQAVKSSKRSSLKIKPGAWFKKVLKGKERKNKEQAAAALAAHNISRQLLSTQRQSLASARKVSPPQPPHLSRRASAPSLQTTLGNSNRDFAELHKQWRQHRESVPKEVGGGEDVYISSLTLGKGVSDYNIEVKDDNDFDEDDGSGGAQEWEKEVEDIFDVDDEQDDREWEDQWEVGSSDLEHGDPAEVEEENPIDHDEFESDDETFLSQDTPLQDDYLVPMEEEAEQEMYEDSHTDPVTEPESNSTTNTDKSDPREIASQLEEEVEEVAERERYEDSHPDPATEPESNSTTTDKSDPLESTAPLEEEVEVEEAPKKKKKKKKSKNAKEEAPENNNHDSFRVDELHLETGKRKKEKNSTSLDDSTRDATETTVDLEFSSSEWTAVHDDPFAGADEAGKKKKKKTKKKKKESPKATIEEESQEEVAEEEVDIPRGKKTKRKSKKGKDESYNDTEEVERAQQQEDVETDMPRGKKSKRQGKKKMEENGIEEMDQDEEVDETEAKIIKKDKRESRKLSAAIAEMMDETQQDAAEGAEEEPVKKSKRKSRKSIKWAEEVEEARESSPVAEHPEAEYFCSPKQKKKDRLHRAYIPEGELQDMLIDSSESGELSILSEGTAEYKDSLQPPRKSSKRKKSRKSRKTKSSKNVQAESISLSMLLDDVVNTRNELQGSVEGGKSTNGATLSQQLLEFLERTLDSFAEVSDALELIITFGDSGESTPELEDAHEAMKCITDNYVPLLNYLWKAHLQSTVERYWREECQADDLTDLLYRVGLILKSLTAQFRYQFIERGENVGSIELDPETKKVFVTLFELLRHEALAVGAYQGDDKDKNEGALTFQLSSMLMEAWGVTSHSQIWHDVYRKATEDPREFRRACIRFVVNESDAPIICVKAMEMLLNYCELEFSELVDGSSKEHFFSNTESDGPENGRDQSVAAVPKGAKLVLKSIRGAPLAREEIVDKVLCRILPSEAPDAPPVSITVLQGRPGVGKTTIAALIAQHRTVREYYCDGILWVKLGRPDNLSLAHYIEHLRAITTQFRDPLEFQQQGLLLHVPGESENERKGREKKGMAQAKSQMTSYLKSKRVLVILDHFSNQEDLEWFDFFRERQERGGTTLVTTRSRGLVDEVNAFSVAKLSEEKEAIWLLHRECNSTARALAGRTFDMPVRSFFESDLVRSMVQICCLHPMTVATFGRFLSLQCQQNGLNGEECLVATAQIFTEFQSTGSMAAFLEVLNMSLSPTACGIPSRAIRLCVVAFVTVFCTERQLRDSVGHVPFPQVPVDIAELLFESVLVLDDEVLKKEELFYQNKKKAAEIILKVLSVLGILADPANSSTQTTYLTHQIYVEYVQDQIENHADIAQFVTGHAKGWNRALASTQFASVDGKGWHRALASNLLDSAADWDESDPRQGYAMDAMVFHMICAGMFVEAGDLLAQQKFVKRRIAALGLNGAVKRQVKDVQFLLEKLVPGRSEARIESRLCYVPVIRHTYQALVDTINKIDNSDGHGYDEGDVPKALVDIGVSFSEWHCYEDAITCWMASLLMSSMTLVERSQVLYNVAAAYVELREHDEAATFFSECLELQRIAYGDNDIYCATTTLQKMGDLLFTKTDYSGALEAYTEVLNIFTNNSNADDIQTEIGDVQEMLGRVCLKKEDHVASVDHYLSALHSKKQVYGKKSPLLTPIYNQIGICLLEMGKKDDAREAFERSLSLVETGNEDGGQDRDLDMYNPDFLISKGVLSGMRGKKKKSRRSFLQAVAILGDDDSNENEWRLSFSRDSLALFQS